MLAAGRFSKNARLANRRRVLHCSPWPGGPHELGLGTSQRVWGSHHTYLDSSLNNKEWGETNELDYRPLTWAAGVTWTLRQVSHVAVLRNTSQKGTIRRRADVSVHWLFLISGLDRVSAKWYPLNKQVLNSVFRSFFEILTQKKKEVIHISWEREFSCPEESSSSQNGELPIENSKTNTNKAGSSPPRCASFLYLF